MKLKLGFKIDAIVTEKRNQLALGFCPVYCIVNEDTLQILKTCAFECASMAYPSSYPQVYGLDIAICNKLKYGEFEVK